MEQPFTLHIVGGNSRSRAEQARLAFTMGYHAEVYADIYEMFEMPPRSGVIVACDDAIADGVQALLNALGEEGIWLPVVAASHQPDVDDVVQAIKAGALDYASLPLDRAELTRLATRFMADAGRHAEARRKLVEARSRISNLSKREREVLDWLSEGCSNKAIARALEISPRTVEIHRANMMDKLGAGHAAEAVRMRMEAEYDPPAGASEQERKAG